MAIPTLRAKNQVTLPAALVKRVGFREGQALDFEVTRTGNILIKIHKDTSEDWLTKDVMAEIDAAAAGPHKTFASMDELERNLNV